jgi:hypothetical protein
MLIVSPSGLQNEGNYQLLCLPLKLDSQANVAVLNHESNSGSNSSHPSPIFKDLPAASKPSCNPLSSFPFILHALASQQHLPPNIMTEKAPSQGVSTEGQSSRLGHRVKSQSNQVAVNEGSRMR